VIHTGTCVPPSSGQMTSQHFVATQRSNEQYCHRAGCARHPAHYTMQLDACTSCAAQQWTLADDNGEYATRWHERQ